jgi:hypothetical protein
LVIEQVLQNARILRFLAEVVRKLKFPNNSNEEVLPGVFYRFAFGFGGKKSQKSAKSVDKKGRAPTGAGTRFTESTKI